MNLRSRRTLIELRLRYITAVGNISLSFTAQRFLADGSQLLFILRKFPNEAIGWDDWNCAIGAHGHELDRDSLFYDDMSNGG